MELTRSEIMPCVFLTGIRTDKFKTACLSISLLTQLDRKNAAKNALIPRVLRRGSTAHPDLDSLSAALDELYGATITPVVRKLGEMQAVGFSAGFVDDACLPKGEGVLSGVIGLAAELLLSPNTRGGLLLPAYVDSEKSRLLDDIRGRINDKTSYALLRMMELMCVNEDYAVGRLGSEDDAMSINYQKLTRRYRALLAESPIEIFYCGSSAQESVAELLRSALSGLPRSEPDADMGTDIRMNSVEDGPRYFTEELDVTQGKLSVGFRLGECMADPDEAAIRVFNAVFGGGVTSKLFRNVRERLQLCYYASSGVDLKKGLLFVNSGIEFEKYDEALDEILTQLEAVRRGDISDDELAAAKLSLSTDLRALSDSPSALEGYWLLKNTDGLDCSPEELAELVDAVTAQDVANVAGGVECDAVYFLRGLQGEEPSDET